MYGPPGPIARSTTRKRAPTSPPAIRNWPLSDPLNSTAPSASQVTGSGTHGAELSARNCSVQVPPTWTSTAALRRALRRESRYLLFHALDDAQRARQLSHPVDRKLVLAVTAARQATYRSVPVDLDPMVG